MKSIENEKQSQKFTWTKSVADPEAPEGQEAWNISRRLQQQSFL